MARRRFREGLTIDERRQQHAAAPTVAIDESSCCAGIFSRAFPGLAKGVTHSPTRDAIFRTYPWPGNIRELAAVRSAPSSSRRPASSRASPVPSSAPRRAPRSPRLRRPAPAPEFDLTIAALSGPDPQSLEAAGGQRRRRRAARLSRDSCTASSRIRYHVEHDRDPSSSLRPRSTSRARAVVWCWDHAGQRG